MIPGRHLRRSAALALAAGLGTSLVACRSAPEPEAPATASRAEVTLALYRQLQLVLDRHHKLVDEIDTAAQAEREELVRLAAEIAVRIVRVDPDADVDRLVERMATLR